MIAVRRTIPEFQFGYPDVLTTGDKRVSAIVRQHEGASAIAVTNFSPDAVDTSIELAARFPGKRLEPIYDSRGAVDTAPVDLPDSVQVEPYGFQWFRVVE